MVSAAMNAAVPAGSAAGAAAAPRGLAPAPAPGGATPFRDLPGSVARTRGGHAYIGASALPDGVTVVRNGMTDQQEERLRAAVRGWLAAGDELAAADGGGEDPAVVMELAERATLARLVFRQTLVDLGWTPPVSRTRESG